MSVTVTSQSTTKAGGLTVATNRTISADAQIAQDKSAPATKAGALSTRTDNDTGIITLGAGHGIVDAQIVDLYWAGGQRRGVTVGTVAGVAVPIDGGAGDNLPIATTAIKVAPRVELTFPVAGDKLKFYSLYTAGERAQFVFAEDDDSEILAVQVGTGSGGVSGFAELWEALNGVDNPLAGAAIAKVFVSQDGVAAKQSSVIALFDN